MREAKAYSNCLEATRGLVNAYRQTAANIRREINDFYARFARENKLEYADAVRYLNNSEALEWKASVEDYIKEISREKDPAVCERLMREYDARSYGARITRLESLNGSIDNELSKLYARANSQFRELLGENYTDGYYRTIFDIQNRFGYSSMFATVNADVVENALSYPWSGANFSDRLWKHKFELQNQLRETLTSGFIRGDSIQTMAKKLAERLDVSRSNATRLIITESSHIHNSAEFDAYKECGFDEYEFMSSNNANVCKRCSAMDGQRFKLSERKDGENFPPLHPICHCTHIPYDPDDDIEGFKDRLENGELSYDKWYEKYVKGREQAKLESKGGAEIKAQSGKPVPVSPTSEKKTAAQTLTTGADSGIIKDEIEKGNIKLEINPDKQARHIKGRPEYSEGKSYLTISEKEAQDIINAKSGTGKLLKDKNGKPVKERIDCDTIIGVDVDMGTGEETPTDKATIHYSKTGTHLVPRKENKTND